MLDISDTIELKSTDSNSKLLFVTRYLVQVNFTFDLTVQSDNFKGTSHFCVRKDELEDLCDNLSIMLARFIGVTALNDKDSDAFLQFQVENSGQLFINGQIGGSHEDNFLNFKFVSDNIAAELFIKDIRNLLLYIDDEAYEKEYNKLYRQK